MSGVDLAKLSSRELHSMRGQIESLPVVVIGSGPGGMSMATSLVESGIKVVVLERGRSYSEDEYKTDQFDFENLGAPWETEKSEWSGPVDLQRSIGIGGTSLYFQGLMHIPAEKVFSGWGLPFDEISRTAKDVASFIGIAGITQPVHPLNPAWIQ